MDELRKSSVKSAEYLPALLPSFVSEEGQQEGIADKSLPEEYVELARLVLEASAVYLCDASREPPLLLTVSLCRGSHNVVVAYGPMPVSLVSGAGSNKLDGYGFARLSKPDGFSLSLAARCGKKDTLSESFNIKAPVYGVGFVYQRNDGLLPDVLIVVTPKDVQ